ncbi:hypothetical protein B9T26_10280 [Acinetobacter sp. ANC 4169]|nr:hypothetical protein B9T26_10280 [Acinetobacter sp. ANC 4169]
MAFCIAVTESFYISENSWSSPNLHASSSIGNDSGYSVFKRYQLVGKNRTNLQKVMCTAKVIVLD